MMRESASVFDLKEIGRGKDEMLYMCTYARRYAEGFGGKKCTHSILLFETGFIAFLTRSLTYQNIATVCFFLRRIYHFEECTD